VAKRALIVDPEKMSSMVDEDEVTISAIKWRGGESGSNGS
jgi:hypothetical protein